MSVRIMGGVWELDLEPPKKLVLLAMADHADHEGRNVHPSIDLVAWKTGYSPRQVQRIVHELTDAGILEVQELGTGRGKPTHYRVDIEKGVKMSPFIRNNGRQDVTHSEKKGDICDTERVTSVQQKGDIAMSPEPSYRTVIESSCGNGAFKPTYRELLGADWPKFAGKYRELDPVELTEPWLIQTLLAAEQDVGPLTSKQLRSGLGASWEVIRRKLDAERNGKGNVRSVRGLARLIVVERLKEVALS